MKLKKQLKFLMYFVILITLSSNTQAQMCASLFMKGIQMNRVELRPLKSTDIEAFLVWAMDTKVTQSLFWDAYKSKEEAFSFLKNHVDSHPWFMAILLNGYPVGAITLDQRTGSGSIRAELGYVLTFDNWGKGIATEAVKQAIEKGFQELSIRRIEALVDPENFGSIRVLEKAGMIREAHLHKYLVHRGIQRDRYIYAVTK